MATAKQQKPRQLFVANDFHSIPVFELLPIVGGVGKWLSAIVNHKILRGRPPIEFAVEWRRQARIEAEQVPKRIMKRFAELRTPMEYFGYRVNYFAMSPAVGPIAVAFMTMSGESGKCHFLAMHELIQASPTKVVERGHFGFISKLPDDGALETITKTILPKPRAGVHRLMLNTDSMETLHREHTKRMRMHEVIKVPASDLIEHTRKQQELQVDDYVRRGVIRPATASEINLIRTQRDR